MATFGYCDEDIANWRQIMIECKRVNDDNEHGDGDGNGQDWIGKVSRVRFDSLHQAKRLTLSSFLFAVVVAVLRCSCTFGYHKR